MNFDFFMQNLLFEKILLPTTAKCWGDYDLLDRPDLEFIRITLVAHDTSLVASSLRLRGVYQSRGDSGLF